MEFIPSTSGPYLNTGYAVAGAVPISMFAWFYAAVLHNGVLACINRSIAQGFPDSEKFSFEVTIDGNVLARQIGPGIFGVTNSAAIIGAYLPGVWNSACAVFESNSSRTVDLNGAAVNDPTTVTIPRVGDTQICGRVLGSGGASTYRKFQGCRDVIAIWNTALTSLERAALAAGEDPMGIQRFHLVLCAPMIDAATVAYNAVGPDLTLNLYDGHIADCATSAPVISGSSSGSSEGSISCCADPVIVDPAVVDLLDARQLQVAHLVQMDFLSTPVYLWNGHHDLTVGGHTWSGLRKLGGIEGLEESSDLTATQMKFTLSGVDANVLALAIGGAREEYVGRIVTVWLQFFDADWQPVGDPIARSAGIMDGINISRSRDSDEQSVRTLTLTAENIFFGRGVPPAGNYTDRDQKFRHSGDRGLEFVNEVQNTVVQIPW
jgi:hypothetical protein